MIEAGERMWRVDFAWTEDKPLVVDGAWHPTLMLAITALQRRIDQQRRFGSTFKPMGPSNIPAECLLQEETIGDVTAIVARTVKDVFTLEPAILGCLRTLEVPA